MSNEFVVNAEMREDQGKGASRRLRRAGKFPAIVYGAGKEPEPITLDHAVMLRQLENEAFYSQVLTLHIGSEEEQAVLRDLQRHPSKPFILHMDFMRIKRGETLRMNIPIHLIGGDEAPGVKEGGVLSQVVVDVEIECLPRNLPEYIEVDVSALDVGDSVHLSDLKLPEGVELVSMIGQEDQSEEDLHATDQPVASIHHKIVKEEEPEVEVEAAEGEAAEGDKAATEGESGDSSED